MIIFLNKDKQKTKLKPMSEELFLNIKKCIENNDGDKTELKKSINKIIDNHFKVKKPLTEYNIFIREQMLLLKDNSEIAPKDKMTYIVKLWNDKKQAILKEKYPDNNGLSYGSRGYRKALQ
jgi:hypothetical protein